MYVGSREKNNSGDKDAMKARNGQDGTNRQQGPGRKPSADAQQRADGQADPFLIALGRHIRQRRGLCGLTRKTLSAASGVSERYLAQLEAGEANITVVLLRRIAAALDTSAIALMQGRTGESGHWQTAQDILDRLDEAQLAQAVQLLQQHFPHARKNRRPIALIGLRGAGKSTIGARIASCLKLPFIELPRRVERQSGMPLSEIFSLYGEEGYRRQEKRCLEQVLSEESDCVIATGGGIVSNDEAFELLLSHCFVVWLQARPEDHMNRVIDQGDLRPMSGREEAMSDLERILESRRPLYTRADFTVDTSSLPPEQSAARIIAAAGR